MGAGSGPKPPENAPLTGYPRNLIMGRSREPPAEVAPMKQWHMIGLVALGAFIALTTTVNGVIASVLNPILTSVKGSYV